MEDVNKDRHVPHWMALAHHANLAGMVQDAIRPVCLDIMGRTVHRAARNVAEMKCAAQGQGPVRTVILGRWDPGMSFN